MTDDSFGSMMEKLSVCVFKGAANVPPQAQMVIALRSFGFEPPEIARRLGYKNSSGVRKLLYRYDPNRVAERGDAVRRLVLNAMFERVIFETLFSLTGEELRALDVKDRMDIAVKATKAMKAVQASPLELSKTEEALLAELKGELIEVEDENDGSGVGGGGEEAHGVHAGDSRQVCSEPDGDG